MAKEAVEFKYEIDQSMNHIVDEKGNGYIALRRVKWFDGEYKLEIRKWNSNSNGETPSKGVSFMTEEGPHELTKALVIEGFGHTEEIFKELSEREDFEEVLEKYNSGTLGQHTNGSDENYYDPKELFS